MCDFCLCTGLREGAKIPLDMKIAFSVIALALNSFAERDLKDGINLKKKLLLVLWINLHYFNHGRNSYEKEIFAIRYCVDFVECWML